MKHVENLLHEGLVEKELSEEIRDKYRWLKSYVTSVLEKQ